MADAAISFAVEKLGDALIQKVKFLTGVEEDVRWLKDELQSMQCFLKDAAEKQGHDERIRKWISDVREVAQDAEDAIETFALKVDAPRRNRGLLERCACFPAHVSHLNRVGEDIGSIRTRLDEIGKRRERYGIRNVGEEPSSRRRWEMVEWRRRMAARFQKDKDVVGLNEDADLLLGNVILDEQMGLSLAAIVGMGGIGKSTLARKIYNHPAVAARFQLRAWVVVSSEFAAEDIMKQIMQQLPYSPDPDSDEQRREEMVQQMHRSHVNRLMEVMSVVEKLRRQEMVQEMLRKRLEGKRYFIVLDDVWEHTDWEALRTAFPDEQDNASRLLFTSRNEIFKKHHGYIHKMGLLNSEMSWELLLKTALIGGSEGRCPQELEDTGREILKKCHGLPLAITVAGGLLVNQGESKSGWDRVLKQIKNYHLDTSEITQNVSAILELSYHNLSSRLKLCFLCLAFFKEDAVIRSKTLVHIWVAQGFVQVPEARDQETVKDIATGYLDELIKRNLIQVKDMAIDDRVKYCSVHDLLRELSIKKAKEEIGFESLSSEDEGSSSSYRPRHRVVRGIGEWPITIGTSNQSKPHLRSLFLHVEGPNEANFTTPNYWKSFELLRILDIEGSRLLSLPSTIRAMIGLRYLRLREEGVLTLPSWLDVLKNLEVLDIADTQNVITFPDVTWRMDSLRHLYIRNSCIFSDSMKKSTWKNLETLKYMSSENLLSNKLVQGFSQRLSKLGVQMVGMKGVAEMGRLLVESAIQVLHLKLGVWRDEELPIPNSLDRLTKLKLDGCMYWCPAAHKFPQSITHLTLCASEFTRSDPMKELGKLPNLLFLKLVAAIKNIEKMKVSHEGFPNLKVLHLRSMDSLTSIEIEEGGMAELQRLEIYECPNLQTENLKKHLRDCEIIIS
ncbi:hypothetical protein ACS0TY_010301 [Phlomoides rotata]